MQRSPKDSSREPPKPQELRVWRGFQLQDFQIQAIAGIESGANVLVSAPTGAGKTLVAEYAIADAVQRGLRCVYTAPIKALSNQKYRDLRDEPDVEVGLMTGDVTIQPRAQVLIMTTEILRNTIFEDPGSLDDVDYVIFDEIHFIDDPERGTVWEESLIFAPPTVRFLALSATIANLDELGGWLREIRPQELCVVRSTRRPVPLKHSLRSTGGPLFDLGRLEWIRQQSTRKKSSRGRSKHGGRGRRQQRGFHPSEFAQLFTHLKKKELLPALVFSFSRRDCERLAESNRRRRLLDEDEKRRMQALQDEMTALFQLGEEVRRSEICTLASQGVGFHHAGMLPIHKEMIERMFTSGLIKLLFTTETFALGINMPARTVVFTSLRKFDGVNFDYLRTRDYLQMAGRAGRLGIDKEGLVICHLDERDLKDAPLKRILSGKPEAIVSRFRLSYSSLLHLYESLGRERLFEAWEKSFNSFQHRERNERARNRNKRQQREVVEAHLALLAELGYIDPTGSLMPRGRVARLLYGYELQITHLLFEGLLETLPARGLAVLFCGLIYEQRARGGRQHVPERLFGGLRRHVDRQIEGLRSMERIHGIPNLMKLPDWGLTEAVDLWFGGADFQELAKTTPATPGEMCRNFRQTVQIARQVSRTLDAADPLQEPLSEFQVKFNRGEVDARLQLELG